MYRRLDEQNHYEILEVSPDASPDEIQSAFDAAKEIYSHDALVTGTILSERERRRTFELISEAYQTLIAEESRRLYDERLGIAAPAAARSENLETELESEPPAVTTPAGGGEAGAEPAETGAAAPETPAAEEPSRRTERRECPIQLHENEEATGEFLRRARELMGLDLTVISEETKIGRSMLEYIETERIDRLPAPVYLRNFTRQVARCLGLDEERVSKTYLERIARARDDR